MCVKAATHKAGHVRRDFESSRCCWFTARGAPITEACPIKAQRGRHPCKRVQEKSLVLVLFYCYSHWDNEIIGIFFFLMRMRQNTLVSKWFSHRGNTLLFPWLLSNAGKLEYYTDIYHDGQYFSCLLSVKWDRKSICLKSRLFYKVCKKGRQMKMQDREQGVEFQEQ